MRCNALYIVLLIAILLGGVTSTAKAGVDNDNLTDAEYFFDTDPGEGSGFPLAAADDSFDEPFESIDQEIILPELTSGPHYLFIRMRNAEGIWGIPNRHLIVVTNNNTITTGEYFYDNDPGVGNAISLTVTNGEINAFLNVGTLSVGLHKIYIRLQDAEGSWGPARQHTFEVIDWSGSSFISEAEYFVDSDPGTGAGVSLSSVDGNFNETAEDLSGNLETSSIVEGAHTLYIRARDSNGNWTQPSVHAEFEIAINYPPLPEPTLVSPIGGITVTVDSDPGIVPLRWIDVIGNNGYKLQIDSLPEVDMTNNQYDASLAVGTYTWKVCTKNASDVCGDQSPPENFTIALNTVAPILNLTAETWTGSRSGVSESTFPYDADVALWLNIQNSGRSVNTYMTMNDPVNGTQYCYYADNTLPTGSEDLPKTLSFSSTKQAMFTSPWTVIAGDYLINRYIYSVINTPGTRTITYWYEDASTDTTIVTATVSYEVEPITVTTPDLVPLYRLYKSNHPLPNFKDHLYTINWAERVSAENDLDYTFERIEGYISKAPFAGSVPLYRLRNTSDSSHFYTTDITERNDMLVDGYVEDGGGITGVLGIEGYVYSAPTEGLLPLYRLHQSIDAPTHYFLCIRSHEYSNVMATTAWGFEDQGVVGYISSNGSKDPLAHRRPQANFGGVDLGTGAYRGLNNLDLLMKGRGPDLAFGHFYNSFNFSNHPMGMGWSHSLDIEITEVPILSSEVGDHNQHIYVQWGDGSGSYFESTGMGASDYVDKTGNHDLLTKINDDSYDLTKKDQTVYEFRRFTITPPLELATFCTDKPSSILCNFSKIVPTKIRDWAGSALYLEYFANNANLFAIRDDMGRRLELDYDLSGEQLTTVTERVDGVAKRFVSFTYNADGLLETFIDANNETTSYSYLNEPASLHHQLLQSITYPRGNTVTIDYISGQATTLIRSGDNVASTIDYDPPVSTGADVSVIDPGHNIVDYKLIGALPIAMKGRNDARWTNIERTDTANPNLPTKITDKKGYSTYYEYDTRGNLRKITNHEGRIAKFYYNDKNNIEWSQEFHDSLLGPFPPITDYIYQENNNQLWKVTNPLNETMELGYDANHQLTSIKDGRDFTTSFFYDTYGNLQLVTDAESNTTSYTSDYAGHTTQVIDGEDIKTTYTYDATDHLKDVNNFTRGGSVLRTISQLYDVNGNLDSVNWVNDGTLSRTSYSYDNRDRLERVTKPGSIDQIFTYYETDQVNTRQDYNNNTTRYFYDDHNRLEQTLYPDGEDVTLARDANGNVESVKASNLDSASRFNYNSLNQIDTYIDPYDMLVGYTYTPAGQIDTITYPGNNEVKYTYDAAGRLKTVIDWNGGKVTYMYDASGNLKEAIRSVNESDTITTLYSYDDASRLTGIAEQQGTATLWSYTYDLDGVGNHNSVNAVNEPLTVSISPENITYTNDRARNLLSFAGNTSYTYDNNGNRKTSITDGVTTSFSWDYENRLTDINTLGQPSVIFAYDGMGNRIARTANNIITRYVLDLTGKMSRILTETDNSGTVKAYYVYGHGLVNRIEANSNDRRFYHFNHRGDSVALSNDLGVITDKYAYDEFGRLEDSSSTGTAIDNPFKYVGRYGVMDEENNLLFMRARFYDARVGRFLSEDPLNFGGGDWNLSGYVGGNPVVGVDPSGLDTYWLKRWIGTSIPTQHVLAHAFIYTTNDDGTFKNTYGWGSTRKGGKGIWDRDHEKDVKAAKKDIADRKSAWATPRGIHIGDSSVDQKIENTYWLLEEFEKDPTISQDYALMWHWAGQNCKIRAYILYYIATGDYLPKSFSWW